MHDPLAADGRCTRIWSLPRAMPLLRQPMECDL